MVLNTIVGRKKRKVLSRKPRVSIAMDNSSNPHEALFIQGRVTGAVEGKDAEEHVNKLGHYRLHSVQMWTI